MQWRIRASLDSFILIMNHQMSPDVDDVRPDPRTRRGDAPSPASMS